MCNNNRSTVCLFNFSPCFSNEIQTDDAQKPVFIGTILHCTHSFWGLCPQTPILALPLDPWLSLQHIKNLHLTCNFLYHHYSIHVGLYPCSLEMIMVMMKIMMTFLLISVFFISLFLYVSVFLLVCVSVCLWALLPAINLLIDWLIDTVWQWLTSSSVHECNASQMVLYRNAVIINIIFLIFIFFAQWCKMPNGQEQKLLLFNY